MASAAEQEVGVTAVASAVLQVGVTDVASVEVTASAAEQVVVTVALNGAVAAAAFVDGGLEDSAAEVEDEAAAVEAVG